MPGAAGGQTAPTPPSCAANLASWSSWPPGPTRRRRAPAHRAQPSWRPCRRHAGAMVAM